MKGLIVIGVKTQMLVRPGQDYVQTMHEYAWGHSVIEMVATLESRVMQGQHVQISQKFL